MLSPVSGCSLTFGTVKIEDMSVNSHSRGGRSLKYSWLRAACADNLFFGKHWSSLEARSSAWFTQLSLFHACLRFLGPYCVNRSGLKWGKEWTPGHVSSFGVPSTRNILSS